MRTALDHLARNVRGAGVVLIEALFHGHDPRVRRRAAAAHLLNAVLRGVEVCRPLPDVAGHVAQAVAVRRERSDGGGAGVAIGFEVLPGELPLPRVRHHLAARRELLAPRVRSALEPTTRGELPLCLGRDLLAGPRGVGVDVLPCEVDDGVLAAFGDVATGPLRTAPRGTSDELPPMAQVGQIDRARRLLEDKRTGYELLGLEVREDRRVDGPLGDGLVPGRADEARVVLVRDGERVHPEAVDGDRVGRVLLREVLEAGTHGERATGDPDHPGRGRITRSGTRRLHIGCHCQQFVHVALVTSVRMLPHRARLGQSEWSNAREVTGRGEGVPVGRIEASGGPGGGTRP